VVVVVTRKELISYVFLAAVAVVMIVVLRELVWPLIAGGTSARWQCDPHPPPPELGPSIGYITLAIVFFAGGNLLGFLRYHPVPDTGVSVGKALLYQVVITVFFFTVALLLLYEAIGTWLTDVNESSPWWPITWYVRCATEQATWATVAAISGVSALVGHWLHRRPA
jgi:hypothetical protein